MTGTPRPLSHFHTNLRRMSKSTPIFRCPYLEVPHQLTGRLLVFKQRRILLSLIKTFYGLHGQASVQQRNVRV